MFRKKNIAKYRVELILTIDSLKSERRRWVGWRDSWADSLARLLGTHIMFYHFVWRIWSGSERPELESMLSSLYFILFFSIFEFEKWVEGNERVRSLIYLFVYRKSKRVWVWDHNGDRFGNEVDQRTIHVLCHVSMSVVSCIHVFMSYINSKELIPGTLPGKYSERNLVEYRRLWIRTSFSINRNYRSKCRLSPIRKELLWVEYCLRLFDIKLPWHG